MVLYFSGSGNSRYAAEVIAANTNDSVVSINKKLKKNDLSPIKCNGNLVIVCPNYCGRIPKVVEEYLRKIEITANNVYFICTCYQSGWNVEKYCRKLASALNIRYCGTVSVAMPQCYVANYPVLNQKDAEIEVLKTTEIFESVASAINEGTCFNREKVGLRGKFMSNIMAPVFYPMMVTAKGFKVNDKCVGCGKCVDSCSLNNICLENGKPVWSNKCTHCMACILSCPEKAIDFKNKTQSRERHFITLTYKKNK